MGDGFYFADSRSESTGYGTTRGDVTKTAVIKGYIKPGAERSIDMATLQRKYQAEIRSGSKLGRSLQAASAKNNRSNGTGSYSNRSAMMEYAIHLGYNVVRWPGAGYYNVIDRSVLVLSDKVTPK